jgi:isoquinoline 1-oxidoreductase beta subunit
VWTREDDVRAGVFRPMALCELRAALSSDADTDPGIEAWHQTVVSTSILGMRSEDGLDGTAMHGADDVAYEAANKRVAWISAELPVPVGFWRSVGHSYNAFAIECFIDELAAHAKVDAVAFRRRLLANAPRHLAVLDAVVEKAGWSAELPAGRARGLAVHSSFESYVAMVAEVSLDAERKLKVERVVVAVDCGLTVHPDTVVAQIEGGVIFGLSAALYGEIHVEAGKVVESNFHDYRLLRMDETPEIVVHLLPSAEPPGGVGEIGVPPIAPAVCNALFALTGTRIRKLPIALSA